MNSVRSLQTWQTSTASGEATEALGLAIGRNLKGGEVIELVSDLGGGKTTFVRGLAQGFGSSDKVASPTFTISKVYKHGQRELHHFDFYRLPEAGLIAHELAEVIGDPNCSVVVEWGEVVHRVLPLQRLEIMIKSTGDTKRKFSFRYPKELAYLLKGVND